MHICFNPVNINTHIMFNSKEHQKPLQVKHFEYNRDSFDKNIITPDFKRINTPVEDINEYRSIIHNLMKAISNNGDYAYFKECDLEWYKDIDIEEMGLIPYCGFEGSHEIINNYMTGLLNKNTEKYKSILPVDLTTIPEVIRALEYSLKKLDKKYGTHKGIVYRQGFMCESPNRYISTTLNPYIASCIYGDWRIKSNNQYSVIQVNNGHRIVDFQRAAGVPSADGEQEILLPYTNNYRKIQDNELTDELRKAKIQLASSLFKDANLLFNGKADKVNGYTKEDLLKMVEVYVQK